MSQESNNVRAPGASRTGEKAARSSGRDAATSDGDGDGEETGLAAALRAIDRALGVMEQAVLVLFLVVLIGIGVTQAVLVKVGSGLGFWSFDVLRYSVFFIAMAGAALSAHMGQLIAMDFVTRALSTTGRARMRVLLNAVTFAVCVLLVLGGLELRANVGSNPEAPIDPKTGILALPLGAALMAVHILLHTIIDLTYLVRGRVPPERFGIEGSVH